MMVYRSKSFFYNFDWIEKISILAESSISVESLKSTVEADFYKNRTVTPERSEYEGSIMPYFTKYQLLCSFIGIDLNLITGKYL